jgi:hypothetical protein
MRDQHEAALHQGDKYKDTDSDKTPTESEIVKGNFNMQCKVDASRCGSRRGSRNGQEAAEGCKNQSRSRSHSVGTESRGDHRKMESHRKCRDLVVRDEFLINESELFDMGEKKKNVHQISILRRRRNECVRGEYERKIKEEIRIKKALSKEMKMKENNDRRLSVSYIQLDARYLWLNRILVRYKLIFYCNYRSYHKQYE